VLGGDVEYKEIVETIFDRLWPIARSITGDGVRETHKIISEFIPLNTYEVSTGEAVFDWNIPKEWKVNEAYIIDPDGKQILDFNENNLHLINYSTPFSGKLSLMELNEFLHSMPEMPDAIPYKTSYYRETWGFCISHKERLKLKEGVYDVVVDTSLFDGALTISDCVIPGRSKKEILVHTYTCHPSLAINELSGVLVTLGIAMRMLESGDNFYTYRFVFAPETIGAITYLSKNAVHLKEYLEAGYICTCVGHDGSFNYKKSRKNDSIADRAVHHYFKQNDQLEFKSQDFSPSGSDERQYCSLGINLPVGSLMRTPYHQYPEYHTSLDNKSVISFKAVCDTVEAYVGIFDLIEKNKTYKISKMNCEPYMSKYEGLYVNKDHRFASDLTKAVKWMIHYSDGNHDLIKISQLSGINVNILNEAASRMCDVELLSRLD